jgi:hypothetical protein
LHNLHDVVQRELHSAERLIWSGAPGRGLRLRSSDALMIPFSLLWGGFAIFWEYTVLFGLDPEGRPSRSAAPLFMKLWGIPFVVVGLYLIVGRFFGDSFQRSRTIYAVTDQRILIITQWFGKRVRSLPLRTLPEMTLAEKSDGSGTITFGASTFGATAFGTNRRGERPPAFEFVERVRNVHDLIQGALNEDGRRR